MLDLSTLATHRSERAPVGTPGGDLLMRVIGDSNPEVENREGNAVPHVPSSSPDP